MTNIRRLIPSPTHLISAPTKQGVEDLLLRILEKVYEPMLAPNSKVPRTGEGSSGWTPI